MCLAKFVFSHSRSVSGPLSSERQRSEVKPIMELEKDSDIHSARDDKAFVAMGTEGKRSVLAELFPEPGDLQTCSRPHPLSFQNQAVLYSGGRFLNVSKGFDVGFVTLYYLGLSGTREKSGDFG